MILSEINKSRPKEFALAFSFLPTVMTKSTRSSKLSFEWNPSIHMYSSNWAVVNLKVAGLPYQRDQHKNKNHRASSWNGQCEGPFRRKCSNRNSPCFHVFVRIWRAFGLEISPSWKRSRCAWLPIGSIRKSRTSLACECCKFGSCQLFTTASPEWKWLQIPIL